jgi:exonuclease III
MKIATFNINNVNKRLANLLDWLGVARPDVACLQELKATDSEFPFAAIEKAGYGAVWRGQKSWNGVAILARDGEPVVTRTALPGDPADTQSRYIEAAVGAVLIATLYAPNGNPQPGPKNTSSFGWSGSWRTPPSFMRSMRPSCWRATTTSCRPKRISTRANPIRTTRSCSRSLAPSFGGFSIGVG